MENLTGAIESILFVASRPLTIREIAKALEVDAGNVEGALAEIEIRYTGVSGIHVVRSEDTVVLSTNPAYTDAVEKFTAKDILGELTKAQLETLTVVGYRGPITRPEIEEIRGVNCSIILRTLLVRDLIEEHESTDSVLPTYTISTAALRQLGVSTVEELPQYEDIKNHPYFIGEKSESAEVLETNTAST
jgi:segregation and condensation protein B